MKQLVTILVVFASLSALVVFASLPAYSQQVEDDSPVAAALEDADSEEGSNDNDYDLQQLERLRQHPIDINSNDVIELPFVDAQLLETLAQYRKLLGDLIDVHELQAVPGFTPEIIRRIKPFVTVSKYPVSKESIFQRLRGSGHSLLMRVAYKLEKSKQFEDDETSSSSFTGGRPALMLRYKYQYRNLLQYGVVMEKDAGETVLYKRAPQFVSFHLFARQLGIIRALAIGDFTVNVGQGLIQWQGQAYNKSSSVISVKRQSETLRPYNSAGEYNFNRGAAATFARRTQELTIFFSTRKLSANVDEENRITSVVTSGLFRTKSEIANRNTCSLTSAGVSVRQLFSGGHVAFNAVHHVYSLPLKKADEPCNLFAIRGTSWVNSSIDYSYTWRNYHFFGELAADKQGERAILSGVIASVGSKADLSILLRSISSSYQSLLGNAFTENTMPTNESGAYTGISLRPSQRWKIDAYADFFSFPWLKFRLDAPSYGSSYLVQLSFRPNKKTELYARMRFRAKPINVRQEDNEESKQNFPALHYIYSYRVHLGTQLSRKLIFRSRLEVSRLSVFNKELPESGYLIYMELHYKPIWSIFAGNARIAAFETSSYDSRIYAYENDLPFVNSVPALSGSGVRLYLNLRGKFKLNMLSFKGLTVSVKLSSTLYNSPTERQLSPSELSGIRNSAIKMQFFLGS